MVHSYRPAWGSRPRFVRSHTTVSPRSRSLASGNCAQPPRPTRAGSQAGVHPTRPAFRRRSLRTLPGRSPCRPHCSHTPAGPRLLSRPPSLRLCRLCGKSVHRSHRALPWRHRWQATARGRPDGYQRVVSVHHHHTNCLVESLDPSSCGRLDPIEGPAVRPECTLRLAFSYPGSGRLTWWSSPYRNKPGLDVGSHMCTVTMDRIGLSWPNRASMTDSNTEDSPGLATIRRTLRSARTFGPARGPTFPRRWNCGSSQTPA
jgi:hypothetical protein